MDENPYKPPKVPGKKVAFRLLPWLLLSIPSGLIAFAATCSAIFVFVPWSGALQAGLIAGVIVGLAVVCALTRYFYKRH